VVQRRSEIADILLRRAVERINRLVKPDVTVVLGDLLDDGFSDKAPRFRRRLRQIIDLLESPTIVLPGNHDGDVDAFYRDFERPPEVMDLKGVRFLPFIDPEEPGYNARRTKHDRERMRAARAGHDGPIVSLQHVPLFPPGTSGCPFNYVNADKVIEVMKQARIGLAIGGHYHLGNEHIRSDNMSFVIAPGLCESPFSFTAITVEGDEVSAVPHHLAMPQELELFDCHVHTPFAYCSDDMDLALSVAVARNSGLSGMTFAEHSGQLYFSKQAYWDGEWMNGIQAAPVDANRMPDYFAQAISAARNFARVGLEVDCDARGQGVVKPKDLARTQLVLGSLHLVPELRKPKPDVMRAADEFLAMLSAFLGSGVQILAHPFRVFRRLGRQVPSSLFEPSARMLKERDVAAEINFHGDNVPPQEFIALCLKLGVKLAFGSDAHALYEVGDFARHLRFLSECGYDGDVKDILVRPASLVRRSAAP
jgi:histidinol phosphatase-like PHP family hydrolase/calcineurin-like phosphoesterase family protein